MKVVINKCYGGFGISRRALIALEKTECPHIDRTDPKEYFGGNNTAFLARKPEYSWEAEFARDQARSKDGSFGPSLVVKGKIVTDEHRNDVEARTCEHLVKIVEKLGVEKASGPHSKLKVVEVPDDVGFSIGEYDGMESVEEIHRSWG